MTAKRINTFRRLLEAKQSDVTQTTSRIRERLALSESGDMVDRMRSIHEREAAMRELALQARLLSGVQEALREIKAGTFGRCTACDGEIPLRRLEAVPWSPHCLRCQEGAESRRASVKTYSAQA